MPEVLVSLGPWGRKSIAFCWGANGFVETHQALGHQMALAKQQRFKEAETDGLNFL